MKHTMKRSLAGILTVFCLVSVIAFRAYAASGKISYSDPTVTVGNNVSVSMTVSGDSGLGTLDATLTYDSSLLEFVSGSGPSGAMVSGGSGSIIIAWSDTSQPGSITFTLTFKTLNSGTAKINTSYAEVYTLDEEQVSLTSKGSSTITINPVPTASSEARLSSLKVGSASLSPSFDPDTYSYSATVAAGTKKAVVSVSTKDSKATYSVSGTSLSVGSNTVTVTVTAEDGSTKKYTINVTRPADPVVNEPDEPDEPEVPEEPDVPEEEPLTVTVEGVVYYVGDNLEGVALPEGFEKAEFTYQDEPIVVAKGLGKPLILFYLTDENGANGDFYIYDQETGECYLYQDITSGQKIYTLIALPAGGEAPLGYTRSNFTLGSEIISAWTSEEQPDFVLVYAMNWEGETGYYRYDTVEQTMQRYVGELTVIPVEPEDPGEEVDEEKELLLNKNQELHKSLAEANELMHKGKLLILGLMGLAVILLVLVICVLIFALSRRKKAADIEDDDDDEPPYGGATAAKSSAAPAKSAAVEKPASMPSAPVKQTPPPVQTRPAPVKPETPKDDDDVDLSRLGLGDIDLSQVDVDDIDFDDFEF